MDAFTENASVNDIFDRFPSLTRAVSLSTCRYRHSRTTRTVSAQQIMFIKGTCKF